MLPIGMGLGWSETGGGSGTGGLTVWVPLGGAWFPVA